MKSIPVQQDCSVLTLGMPSDLSRLPALPGRPAVTSVAGRAPRSIEPLPAIIAAEIRKAGEALVRSRRLRRCAERWIYERIGSPAQ